MRLLGKKRPPHIMYFDQATLVGCLTREVASHKGAASLKEDPSQDEASSKDEATSHEGAMSLRLPHNIRHNH